MMVYFLKMKHQTWILLQSTTQIFIAHKTEGRYKRRRLFESTVRKVQKKRLRSLRSCQNFSLSLHRTKLRLYSVL